MAEIVRSSRHFEDVDRYLDHIQHHINDPFWDNLGQICRHFRSYLYYAVMTRHI